MYSIVSVWDGLLPPAKQPLVVLEKVPIDPLVALKSPKSVDLPIVAIVLYSIIFIKIYL